MALPPTLEVAYKFLGLNEKVNGKNNPIILDWYKDLGISWIKETDTPWCGTFVAYVAKQAGRKWIPVKDNPLGAQNWSRFPQGSTKLSKPALGCVAVYTRKGSPGSGHVGFVAGKDKKGNIMILGGNQSNSVKLAPYTEERLIGYYWLHKSDGTGTAPDPSRYDLPIVNSDGKFETNEA